VAAALARRQSISQRAQGLQPTCLARDLYQIAELIELCFSSRLDSSGQAVIREMKALSRLWPLLVLLESLDRTAFGLGTGYVWRERQRVVGNVSLYRGGIHPWLGKGWLIANVAVHPDHRRQGIARAMMQASLDMAREMGGRWVALQVEAGNEAALALYDALGFKRYETLAQWECSGLYNLSLPSDGQWLVRRRRPDEVAAETRLIFNGARQGGMIWTRPIDRVDLLDSPFTALADWVEGQARKERWVLPDPFWSGRLLGSMWVERLSWRRAQLTLFLEPTLTDPAGRCALLQHVLSASALEGWVIRLETVADDAPIEELLQAAGFRQVRRLVQMRYSLEEQEFLA
jgi:ribosomal protein S18 acetylase RimI-like enzyme